MADYYPNTGQLIFEKLDEIKNELIRQNIEIDISAAAEYYIDEHFFQRLENDEKLLSFGESFVLVETPFYNKPLFLNEALFKLKSLGYQPVLAHPERYIYLQENYSDVHAIFDSQVYLQINIPSLVGYYSKPARKLAEYLIDHEMVQFLGSDLHNMKQFEAYKKALGSKYFDKCRQLFLYNQTLS